MVREKAAARRRIGRVSLYLNRRLWYGYYRREGRAVRQPLGSAEPAAEIQASILNAQLVAESAGLHLADVARELLSTIVPVIPVTSVGPADLPPSIAVAELRRRFLHHHEEVLRSAPGTMARYTTATRYLCTFCEEQSIVQAMAVPAMEFAAYLRQVEVSPNGHGHSPKRRLLDKGVRYVLETCRSMYHFGQRHGHLPRNMPNPFSEMGVGKLRIRNAKAIFVFGPQEECGGRIHSRPCSTAPARCADLITT